MSLKENVKKDLKSLEGNETKLYSYLYDLIYNETIKDLSFLEKLYSSYLDDERTEIKRIAIYSLLFALKLRKEKYLDFAIENLIDANNDFQLRLTCVSGVTQAYLNTQNKRLTTELYNIYKSFDEDEDIKTESFVGILKVLGLTSKDIIEKNNKMIIGFQDINLENFSEEVMLIEEISS